MKVFISLLILLISTSVWAQKTDFHTSNKRAISKYEEATRNYGLGFTDPAVTNVLAALELDSNFLEAQVLLGEIYLDEKNYTLAISELKRAVELDTKNEIPVIYRMLAEAEINELQLQEAIDHLETYKSLPGVSDFAKKKADELLELVAFRKHMIDNPVPYNPINLGPEINSEWFEHSPTLTVDEEILYFTRKRPIYFEGGEKMDEDLFVSYRQKSGKWSPAKPLGKEINSLNVEGASAISPDGNYLFFTRCSPQGMDDNCDIFIAARQGDSWGNARNLGEVVNSRYWESQPTFAPDGRTLYYVKQVGKGRDSRKNIYETHIQDNGLWSKPVSLPINTSGNEESPFLHPDGQTFYFTSDGYPGMGGRDLFMVKIDSNRKFGEPINLGYPINSAKDEVSLIVTPRGDRAYFASGMPGGYGNWDLYSFTLPQNVRPVPVNYTKGLVYNKETKVPIGAKFEIIDLESGNIVVESFSDRKSGKFLVTIPTGREYAVNVSAPGFLFYSATYQLPVGDDSSRVSFDIPLSPIKQGEAIVLNNVFFEFNSYELMSKSKIELNKLVELLQKNPQISIEIGGHTDNQGSQSYNQTLSENRAKSVYTYIVNQGVSPDRLSYKGYNYSQPLATNDTPEGRAKNRRTEFKIIKVTE
jgi:outer membrane protein OmpA-like peptidoglycan-associated protein